jgi:membrane carboxypeptidase/penicillin-binding protein
MATVYATRAAGGVRPSVHLLDAALDRDGRAVALAPLPKPARAIPAPVAFLVTDVLRGVLDRGTGRSARGLGVEDALAGKTGTSNDGRDAWFAGYSPERATVVWVGRDDDRPSGLSGARAALPIWARFVVAVRPAGGYAAFVEPAGVMHVVVDPASGELATSRCPEVREELFLAGRAPATTCHLHGGWLALAVAQPQGVPVERPGLIRRLLARLFARRAR